MWEPFSIDVVARALAALGPVAAVAVVERLPASGSEVARLDVRFSDGRPDARVIGKAACGAGAAAVRRELAFFARVAPGWDSRAPALLGADGDAASIVIFTEDLAAAGYASIGPAVSTAQLRGAIEGVAALHARFWDAIPDAYLADRAEPTSVTRCARAWPPASIARNAGDARAAAARFTAASALTCDEREQLAEILDAAPGQLAARAADGRGLTLIHADYHFFGNVLFADGDPRPRVIDWSELKPGLGPHDVAYCMTAVPADDRAARDRAMLRVYWEQLRARGVRDYDWPRCQWDHRLSLIHNVVQALFQDSLPWLRHSLAAVERHAARAVLHTPPP